MSRGVAIIGSGIAGLSIGQMLIENGHNVTIFEKESVPGGLIRCSIENGNLFHQIGGHVFNSKVPKVSDWFWSKFDKEKEFLEAKRNAKIFLNEKYLGYPIENYLYQLPEIMTNAIIKELGNIEKKDKFGAINFHDFLLQSFGCTLFKYYFKPYNQKIWQYDLNKIPLPWLKGKLPMPNYQDILMSNIYRKEEDDMIHSHFYYPKKNGSSFIVERLANKLNIEYNKPIEHFTRFNKHWLVDNRLFDDIIYTGDVRLLSQMFKSENNNINKAANRVAKLKSNGTSNVLCYTDKTDISWLYLPNEKSKCHRIIYTGNFSPNNNKTNKLTCTVEFTGKINRDEIDKELTKLPGNLIPISYNYNSTTYVIQEFDTRKRIEELKGVLNKNRFFLLGRFAEWEYNNMDKIIESSIELVDSYF